VTALGEGAEAIVDRIGELLPAAQCAYDERSRSTIVTLAAAQLEESLQRLRDDPALGFAVLIDLFVIDRAPAEPRFQVVYQLVAPDTGHRLRAVVNVDVDAAADACRVPSVREVWPAADWLEREAHDLFGLVFEGHPELRRILLDEDFEGHPLRKDFVAVRAGADGEPA